MKRPNFIKLGFITASFGLAAILCFSAVRADQELISLFPLENYNQNLSDWIKPSEADYDKPLLSEAMQQHHKEVFYNHYFGNFSPWDATYVNQITHKAAPDDLKNLELSIINNFSNQNKPAFALGFGANFHPYTQNWIDHLATQINLSQFDQLNFHPDKRAIAIDNLHARALPTDDVHFYSYKLAGQGYPFDNLQMSSVWAGTPLYVLGETLDHQWSFVITPEFIGWVKTKGLAYTNENFVSQWKAAAKKNLAVIVQSETSILDEKGQFQLSAYVGAVFPAETGLSHYKLMLPASDSDRKAFIKYGTASEEQAVLMPLQATPHYFSQVMSSLLGRPYGWGGMYFYNDCSSELKNLLTPFGIWLPRHSSDQVYAGKLVDMTASAPEQRLTYLMQNGHRFLTIVYIGGHVFLYVGTYPNPNDKAHPALALTYQDMWGLSPNPPERRAVIGQSVLFPLLLQYPEDSSLTSLAAKKFFQVAYLDELPNYQIKLEAIDLKALMSMS
jgi:cell wall-associated NlpC family hydrolase